MKRTTMKFIVLTVIILPFLNSCNMYIVEGNNEVSTEIRATPNFSKIELEGSFEVSVENSDTIEVSITCESNLIPYIETRIKGKELIITTPNAIMFQENYPIKIHIKAPFIESLEISGSGEIITDSIRTSELNISISGSGTISAIFIGNKLSTNISGSGSVNAYAINNESELIISGSGQIKLEGMSNNTSCIISGSGNFNGFNYTSKTATAKISGSGEAYLFVSNSLNCLISGSGNILYKGSPTVHSTITGSGRVINANN